MSKCNEPIRNSSIRYFYESYLRQGIPFHPINIGLFAEYSYLIQTEKNDCVYRPIQLCQRKSIQASQIMIIYFCYYSFFESKRKLN